MKDPQPIPGGHMYVDESTAGDYLVMCAVIPSGSVASTRAAMRGLLLPRQRSLHMKDEKARAAVILATIVELRPTVLIYRVPRTVPAMQARRACVHELSRHACHLGLARVVLDPIESIVARDRAWIIEGAHQAGHRTPPFVYHHHSRYEEPLLWISDAVGWAWARGGSHRAAVTPIVTVVDL